MGAVICLAMSGFIQARIWQHGPEPGPENLSDTVLRSELEFGPIDSVPEPLERSRDDSLPVGSSSPDLGEMNRLLGIRNALREELELRQLYTSPTEQGVRRLIRTELNERFARWAEYNRNGTANPAPSMATIESRSRNRMTRLHEFRLVQTGMDAAARESIISALVQNEIARNEIRSQDRSGPMNYEIRSDEDVVREFLSEEQFQIYLKAGQQFDDGNSHLNAMSVILRDAGPMSREGMDRLAEGVVALKNSRLRNSQGGQSPLENRNSTLAEIEQLESWYNTDASQADSEAAWFYFERLRLNAEESYADRHLYQVN